MSHRSPVARLRCLTLLLLVSAALVTPVAAQTRLLRFPAVYGDKVAFTYAGDIWTAPVAGGTATRLTAHPSLAAHPGER